MTLTVTKEGQVGAHFRNIDVVMQLHHDELKLSEKLAVVAVD
jgi:hypothetical protein